MPSVTRALVYPPPAGARSDPSAATLPTDDYLAKIVKYVPAEVIAFFTPIAAFVKDDSAQVVAVTVVGAIGTVLWLLVSQRRANVPPDQGARWYSFAFALVAFLVWALSVSSGLRTLTTIPESWSALVLGSTVLLLPALDWLISNRSSS